MRFQWCQKCRSRCKIWEPYKRRSWVRKQRRRQTASGGSVRAGPRSADQTYREGNIYIYVYDRSLCFGSVNMSPQLAFCKIKRVKFDVWTLTCTCQPWGPTPAHQTEGRPCRWTVTLQPGCSCRTPGWTDRGGGWRKETMTHWDLWEMWNFWTFPSRADVFRSRRHLLKWLNWQSCCSHSLHWHITMQCWQ